MIKKEIAVIRIPNLLLAKSSFEFKIEFECTFLPIQSIKTAAKDM